MESICFSALPPFLSHVLPSRVHRNLCVTGERGNVTLTQSVSAREFRLCHGRERTPLRAVPISLRAVTVPVDPALSCVLAPARSLSLSSCPGSGDAVYSVNEVSFSFVPFPSVVYRSLLLHAETLYWLLTLSLFLLRPLLPSFILPLFPILFPLVFSLSLLLSAILFHFFSFSFSSLSLALFLLPPPSFSSRFLSLPILCFSSLFLPFYLYLRAYIYTSHM